ncbi:hypothetical protein M5K25_016087 [Dendrobium thyrsiflorum]|uniref:Uncharacterized protein n=1 Tax=Dendrobium thyrsiflorum TaxID=117978 RepID=A0ABD0USS7_DENTH
MDPEQLGRTLDLLVGQMGAISQQLKENQSDLAELRRQTTERFDSLERGRNQPPLYTPSRPPSIFEYDEEGRTDILNSPFFDVSFGADPTADEYLDRILYRLTLALEEHIVPGSWIIIGHPPPPPTPAIFPTLRILRASVLVLMSLARLSAVLPTHTYPSVP